MNQPITSFIGLNPQAPTVPAVAPPTEAPPAPVVNRQAHPKANIKPAVAANALLKDAETKLRQHLSTIDPVGLSEERLHREITAFTDSPAAKQITEAENLVDQRVADAEKHVADIEAGLSPKGDVAEELRATRAWNRARLQLDAADSTRFTEVARNLIANADDEELGVLMQELPSYCAAKGQGAEWLDGVVEQRVPALAEARRQLTKATQARQIVRRNAENLRDRITGTPSPKSYRPVNFVPVSDYDPDA